MGAPELDRFYRENKEEVGVLAVALGDSVPAIRQFMDDAGLTFPLMVDPGSVGQAYKISVIPTMALIDASGGLREMVGGVFSAEELKKMVDGLSP